MAIPRRNSSARSIQGNARTFFVTSSVLGKRSMLQSERSAQLFVEVLYRYRDEGKFKLHEFVVMPDHFHVLVTVDSTSSIERAVQFIKGGFAYRATRELGFRAPVWQRGFSEVRVEDAASFAGFREYIRENPVKHGLAARAEDYPYSSAGHGFPLDPAPQGLEIVAHSRSG